VSISDHELDIMDSHTVKRKSFMRVSYSAIKRLTEPMWSIRFPSDVVDMAFISSFSVDRSLVHEVKSPSAVVILEITTISRTR
jgi:hypothetical protein